MKVAILGNGSIGLASAAYLAKKGHKVYLFGTKNRIGSATKAAGAMFNCFGEIENQQLDNSALKKKFVLSKDALNEWFNFLPNLYDRKETELIKKRKTIVFTNKFTSPYEQKNFTYLKNLAKDFNNYLKLLPKRLNSFPYELKGSKEFILINEGFLSTNDYLERMDKFLSKLKVKKIFNVENYKITLRNNKVQLKCDKKIEKQFDYLIVALGSYTIKLMKNNSELFKGVQKIFFGTGFAYHLFPREFNNKISNDNNVYRTMNRGNACGYHLVPGKNSSFYFGASSTVTHVEENFPRISSISVLSGEVKNQFDKRFSQYLGQAVLGHRPVTADTYPLLGPLKASNRIIIATGNKRDGFTASTEIGRIINNYVGGDVNAFEKYEIFKPNRKLISYFNKEIAIRKTAEAKISGEFMHKRDPEFNEWEKLVKERSKEIEKIYDMVNLSKEFGVHPEILSLFLYGRI